MASFGLSFSNQRFSPKSPPESSSSNQPSRTLSVSSGSMNNKKITEIKVRAAPIYNIVK